MLIQRPEAVLTATECAIEEFGKASLCQIVRAQGSTPGKVGWKLLVRPDGTTEGNLGGGAFEALVCADALAKLNQGGESEVRRYYLTEEAVRGEATGMVCGGFAEVFVEVLRAPPVLVVCGGGPVGQALARVATLAGFEILVADDREEFRSPSKFPDGVRFAAVDREFLSAFLAPVAQRELFVAIVSRCWETDVAALAAVLRQAPSDLRYLGLMGSRRKIARVREEVAALGFDLAGVELRAPIGLPLGGDSPGEIALSIVAEMVAVRNGRIDRRSII